MLLGSAEIRVPEKAGKTYAAPNLIYHYMKDRGYLPPQEFLRCLGFNGQRITSIEHPREMCKPQTCPDLLISPRKFYPFDENGMIRERYLQNGLRWGKRGGCRSFNCRFFLPG